MNEQTNSWGFRAPPAPRQDDLVALWQRVLFNAETAPACPCHGIYAGRLDPDTIETNLLAPLRTSYRQDGQRDLSDFLERRMRKSPFAGMRQPFDKWLAALPEARLSPDERQRLATDLRASLSYHAEQQPEFVCS